MKTWTLTDVAKHWDDTIDYDEINAKTDSYFRRFTDTAPLFSLPENAEVLDIDCRTGNGSYYFAQRHPTCRFTALAVSPLFRDLAQKLFDEKGVNGVTGIFESIPLPFPDDHFDAIFTYETIEHIPWPDEYITELARLTKSGGLIVLTTPNLFWEPIHLLAPVLGLHHSEGPHKMLSRGRLRSLFQKNELQILKEKTFVLIPAGPKWLLNLGRKIERLLPDWLLEFIALRQTFVCIKNV